MKVKVQYGPGDPAEVDLSELNFLCHQGQFDVNVVESEKPVIVIASPATLNEVQSGFEPHWAFPVFWKVLRVAGVDNLPEIEEISRSGSGFTHLAGLVNMALKVVMDTDALPHFRYPESHLHPSVQACLADFFVALRYPWEAIIAYLQDGGELTKPIPIKYKNQDGEERRGDEE